MDDPVTHFDDLNIYAFLDLIEGLLETSLEGRQFIISTCDERLFQIAKQKFKHFRDRAKFYTYKSISNNGPQIKQM